MAAFKVRKFSNVFELETFLNGGIVGGPTLGGVSGIVGTTLTFTSPASFSCTFVAGATPGVLTFAEIKAQIETASTATVRVFAVGENGRIGLIETSVSSGIALAATSSNAKLLLGFPKTVAVVGTVYLYDPTASAPCVFSIYNDVQSASHVAVTWE